MLEAILKLSEESEPETISRIKDKMEKFRALMSSMSDEWINPKGILSLVREKLQAKKEELSP